MKIFIKNFRCYNDFNLEFDFKKIILLKGCSGSGKTTILNTIYWCFYGELNNIYPNDIITNNNITSVEIIIDELNLKIRRSKPPEIFEITLLLENKILTNESAQIYLNEKIGNASIFTTSSYVIQGNKNPLLTISNIEKFNILRYFVFDDKNDKENPKYYTKKINDKMNEIKDKISLQSGYCNSIKDNFKIKQNQKNIILDEKINSNIIKIIQNKIEEYNEENNNLNEKLKKSLIYENNLLIKKNEYNKLKIEYENNITNINKLEDLNILETKYSNLLIDNNKLEILANKLKTIYYYPINNTIEYFENILKDYNNLESNNIYNIEETIKEYSELIKKEKINKQKYIDWQEKYKKYSEIYEKDCSEYSLIYKIKCDESKFKFIELQNTILENNNILKNKYDNDLKKYNEYNEYIINLNINNNIKKHYDKEIINLKELQKKEFNNIKNEWIEYNIQLENFNNYNLNLLKFKNLLESIDLNYENIIQNNLKNFQNEMNDYLYQSKKLLEENICPHCNKGFIFSKSKIEKGILDLDQKNIISKNIEIYKEILNIIPLISIKILNPIKPLIENKDYFEFINTIDDPIYINLKIIEEIKKPTIPCYEKILLNEDYIKPEYEYPIFNFKEKEPIKEIENLDEYIKKFEILKTINIPKISKQEVENSILSLNNKIEYDLINLELKNLKLKISKENNLDIKKLKLLIDEYNKIFNTINDLKSKISIIKNELEILEFNNIISSTLLIEKIEINKQLIIENTEKIKNYEQIIELNDLKKEIDLNTNKLLDLSSIENNLNKIKTIIIEIETFEMEKLIKNINELSNIFLQYVFEDPIEISLSTQKNLKSNKDKIKNCVNMKINYKGFIYDNINELSFGEKSRISLILTLVVNKINSYPFILLDEILSSLDSELHEKIFDLLKDHFNDKCIINVCHNIVEGFHDTIINL